MERGAQMTIIRAAPRWMMDRKAPHGQPCTSCGLCCTVALCDLAAAVYRQPKNAPGPCPALEWTDGRSGCGLLRDPARYVPRAYAIGNAIAIRAATILLSPGHGCDMSMMGDRNEAFHRKREAEEHARFSLHRWAWRVWGMTDWIRHNIGL